jgi:isocitrate/isopropylmalate dehydrogenase
MLLHHSLGLVHEARVVERAIEATIVEGMLTADVAPTSSVGATTMEVTRHVTERVGKVTV